MDASAAIPSPHDGDDEDVHWALSTASALWNRGERAEALKWLRRAAETASDANADTRALELFKAAAEVAQRIGSIPPASATSASAAPPSASGHPPATQASAVPPASGPVANGPQVGVVHARQAPPPRRPNASFKQTATLMSPGAQSAPSQQPPPPPPPPSSRRGAVPPAPGSDPGRPPPLYAREPRSVQPPRSGEGPSSASSARIPPAPGSNRGMPPEPFAPASPRQGHGHAHSHAAPTQHGGGHGGAQPSTSPYGGGSGSGHSPAHAQGTQQYGTHAHAGHHQSGHPQSGPRSAHPQSAPGHGAHPQSARGAAQGAAGSHGPHGHHPGEAYGHGTPSFAASTVAAPLAPLIDDDSDDEQLAEMAQARTPIGGIAAVPHDARIAMRGRRYDEEVTIRRDISSLGIRFEDLDEETHIGGKPQPLGRVVVAVERFQPDEPPPSSTPPSSERRHASAAPISVSGLRAYDDIRDEPAAAIRRAVAEAQRGARGSSSRAGQPLEPGLRATQPLELATVPALRVAVLGTADQGEVQLVLLPHGSLAPEGAATAMLLPASAADAAAIARLFEPPSDDDD